MEIKARSKLIDYSWTADKEEIYKLLTIIYGRGLIGKSQPLLSYGQRLGDLGSCEKHYPETYSSSLFGSYGLMCDPVVVNEYRWINKLFFGHVEQI